MDKMQLAGLVAGMFAMGNTYAARVVGRVEPEANGGVGVSTAFTTDHGFETALLDANGAWPVERYVTEADAVLGHARWTALAPSLAEVTSLGSDRWGVPDLRVVLEKVGG